MSSLVNVSEDLILRYIKPHFPSATVSERKYYDRDCKTFIISLNDIEPSFHCAVDFTGLEMRQCSGPREFQELFTHRMRTALETMKNGLAQEQNPLADIIQAVGKNRQAQKSTRSRPGVSEKIVEQLQARKEQLKQNILENNQLINRL